MNNNRIIEGAKIQISNTLPFLVYFMTKQSLPVIFGGSPENFILIFVLLNFYLIDMSDYEFPLNMYYLLGGLYWIYSRKPQGHTVPEWEVAVNQIQPE